MDSIIEKEKWKAYIIYRTIHEMLTDRGFNLPKLPEYNIFYEKFCDEYGILPSRINFTFTARRGNHSVLVYFLDDETIGIKHVLKLYDLMTDKGLHHCIFVYKKNITFTAKKFLMSKKEVKIEIFAEDELIFNPTKHKNSPKYILLSDEQKREVLKFYSGTFPRLLTTDPVAKYLGLKKDDVLQINRKSETSGIYVTFRAVY